MLLLNPFWFFAEDEREEARVPACHCAGHLAPGILRGFCSEDTQERTESCKRLRNLLGHTARKRASQDLKPALLDSVLGLPRWVLCSYAPLLVYPEFRRTFVQQSRRWCNWWLLPLPPIPKQKQEKNLLSLPCSPVTLQSHGFLSLSSKAPGKACGLCTVSSPHLALLCSWLRPRPSFKGLHLCLSSKNLQHSSLRLTSLTFENAQYWPALPSRSARLPRRHTTEPFSQLAVLHLTSTSCSSHPQAFWLPPLV